MKLIKFAFSLLITTVLLNACSKEYSVENGGLQLPTGNWEFSNGTKAYFGNMDSAKIDSSGATKQLRLNGTSSSGESFKMILYGDTIKVGSYKASLFQSTFTYATTAKTIYEADQLVGQFIVNITSYTSNLVQGTFSGSAKDSSGAVTQITVGKFKSTLANGIKVIASTGVLGDSSGNCKPVVLSGTYTQGVAMTAANTARVKVVVAVAGTYTISTNTVNGVTFSNSGTFINTGSQDVILTASGNSSLGGSQVFTLHYGNSQCAYTVNFLPGVAASGDYLPLTTRSNWNFSLVGGTPNDSIFRKVIAYAPTLNGNVYETITESPSSNAQAVDSSYFRKGSGNYYQYLDLATLLNFDNPVILDLLILKDNVAQGTTWNSSSVTGTIGGVPFSGYIKMTILEKAVPVTIGYFNFTDVIKVRYEMFMTGVPVAIQTSERWFAKNVGEVHSSVTSGTSTITYEVGNYQIF
jgi:hypothetical protein